MNRPTDQVEIGIFPARENFSTIADLPEILPYSTTEFVEALETEGIAVSVAATVDTLDEVRATDVWLPLLVIGGNVTLSVAASLIANAIDRFVAKRKSPTSTIRLRLERDSDGMRTLLLDLDSDVSDVVQHLREISGT